MMKSRCFFSIVIKKNNNFVLIQKNQHRVTIWYNIQINSTAFYLREHKIFLR